MSIVRPFKGVRYNLEKVLLKQVIAPPYDVITSEMREELLSKSPFNVVNIDFPQGETRYADAANLFNQWKNDGVLIKSHEPVFYMYEQEYTYNEKSYVRTGFIGLLKLEELGKGTVFPHEKTLSGPKKDRLDLMIATKANLSQIFGLYADKDNYMNSVFSHYRHNMPTVSAMDSDGVKHTLWAITDEKSVQGIQSFMKDKSIYIADGHHRYETALTYRDMQRQENNDLPTEEKPYDYVMMMFVNFYDPGLMIFPTHRVVDLSEDFNYDSFLSNLSKNFDISDVDRDDVDRYLSEHNTNCSMVMISANGYKAISIKNEVLEPMNPVYRHIDTYILETLVFNSLLNISPDRILAKDGVYFYQTQAEVEAAVQGGNKLGFIMNSISIDAIRQISESGNVMPQKSTYFYPKLATGLVFNEL